MVVWVIMEVPTVQWSQAWAQAPLDWWDGDRLPWQVSWVLTQAPHHRLVVQVRVQSSWVGNMGVEIGPFGVVVQAWVQPPPAVLKVLCVYFPLSVGFISHTGFGIRIYVLQGTFFYLDF